MALWAAYGNVVLYDYAWTDDYSFLYGVHSKALSATMPLFFNQQGRPVGGVIIQSVFRAAGSLERLKWVRLADLGLAFICGLILAVEFRRLVPGWIGFGAVSLMLLNPALSICVGWPSNGLLSLPAAVLALVGGVWWLRTLERDEPHGVGFWLRLVASGILTIVALMTYQPSACFFLLPAAIRLLGYDPKRALRGITWSVLGFTAVCIIYFVAFRVNRARLGDVHSGASPRADLVTDIPARLRFFVFDILQRSLESWAVFFGPTVRWTILVVVVALTLVFLARLTWMAGGRTARFHALLLVFGLLGLASSPLLVVKDSYAPYRTLLVLYSLAAVGVAGGITALWRWLPENRRAARTAVAVLWIALLLANGASASYITTEGFVLPNVREMDLYRRFVRHRLLHYPGEVIFVLSDPQSLPRLSRIDSYHEFGTPSSTVEWTPQGLLCSLFNDEHRRTLPDASPAGWQMVVHEIHPGDQTLFAADLPVIDAAQVLNESWMENELPRSGPVIQDKFFGEVQQLTPTLRLARWFGLYEVLSPSHIIHRDLGDLELGGRGGEDCWFHRDGIGWFWTGPALFPRIYSTDRKHWLRYVRGTRQPAKFYDTGAPGQPLISIE